MQAPVGAGSGASVSPGADSEDLDRLVEVAMPAVRAIVAVAVRALEASPVTVTLAQYRMLLVVGQSGPTRAAALAGRLGVDASTVTRMSDRLIRDGLVRREGEPADRRAVRLALTPQGRRVVSAIGARRRKEFAALLQAVPVERRPGLVTALQELGVASRALPDPPSTVPSLGWIA